MAKQKANILIIDDDEDVLFSANLLLKQKYSDILTRSSTMELNQLISTHNFDLIILDMNFRIGFNDGKEGIYWLKHILEIKPETVVILMTAYGEVELAVNAIKTGAFDFVLKPWNNEKFLATVHAGLQHAKTKKKVKVLEKAKTALETELDKGTAIANSELMQDVMQTVTKVSSTDANVLILGENGTGKQHLAREIHKLSKRKDGPFIHVDLGSIPETLFESELFGHKKGAFTDAKEDKSGKFELAQGGTIFLDEIGNLPLNLQSKLLTVIQDQKINCLGDTKEQRLDVRMLFATNAPINEWVNTGKFREDLLYRIKTVEIEIPPLRKRPEDISGFVEYFLNQFKDKYNKPKLRLNKDALYCLIKHKWPGNIRELQHTLERGVILSNQDEISIQELKLEYRANSTKAIDEIDNFNLHDIEKLLVEKALEKHQGNITKAAKDLGLTRAALYRRMEKFNL